MIDLARREWLQSLLPTARDALIRGVAASLDRAFPRRRRPPGAGPEASFLALCTRCGDCVKACPHAAIHTYVPGVAGLAGTPVLVPDTRPCHMCVGFPCAAACETGALEVPATETWPLGSVRVDESRCLAFAGPDCGACASLCPGGVDALELRRGRPAVDEASCVGCGRCIEACPVLPAAIELLPLAAGA